MSRHPTTILEFLLLNIIQFVCVTSWHLDWQRLDIFSGALRAASMALPPNATMKSQSTLWIILIIAATLTLELPMMVILFHRGIAKRSPWRFRSVVEILLSCWWRWRSAPIKWRWSMFQTWVKEVSINPEMFFRRFTQYLSLDMR